MRHVNSSVITEIETLFVTLLESQVFISLHWHCDGHLPDQISDLASGRGSTNGYSDGFH